MALLDCLYHLDRLLVAHSVTVSAVPVSDIVLVTAAVQAVVDRVVADMHNVLELVAGTIYTVLELLQESEQLVSGSVAEVEWVEALVSEMPAGFAGSFEVGIEVLFVGIELLFVDIVCIVGLLLVDIDTSIAVGFGWFAVG